MNLLIHEARLGGHSGKYFYLRVILVNTALNGGHCEKKLFIPLLVSQKRSELAYQNKEPDDKTPHKTALTIHILMRLELSFP